jgi:hypothetical protein
MRYGSSTARSESGPGAQSSHGSDVVHPRSRYRCRTPSAAPGVDEASIGSCHRSTPTAVTEAAAAIRAHERIAAVPGSVKGSGPS